MKQLSYEDYEDFVCDITDKLDEIVKGEEFNDISIIAKYESAKEIVKELLCVGADIASVELHREDFEEYWDEYIISVTKDGENYGVWCEKFKREKGYLTEESAITYVMDNCNSKVIPHIKSKIQFEVSVSEDSDECDSEDNAGNNYHITIKRGLDLDEAFAKLDKMEVRMSRMNDVFKEMDNFRRLFKIFK